MNKSRLRMRARNRHTLIPAFDLCGASQICIWEEAWVSATQQRSRGDATALGVRLLAAGTGGLPGCGRDALHLDQQTGRR